MEYCPDAGKISGYSGFCAETCALAGSTNDLAKEALKKSFEGVKIIAAGAQSEGRGRKGRSFFSPEGGVYMSIAFYSAEDTCYTVIAAEAVRESILELYGIETSVKWVNDLFYNGKKVCGILAESVFFGKKTGRVIGIGINLSGEFEGELGKIAGSLGVENAEREMLIADIAKRFFKKLREPEKTVEDYRRHCFTLGSRVSFKYSHDGETEMLSGTAVGIENDGSLLVDTQKGRISLFYGEVSIEKNQ